MGNDFEGEQPFEVENLSLGVQRQSTRFVPRAGEVFAAENARFKVVGGVSKAAGYAQRGTDLTTTTSTSSSSSTTTTSTSTSSSTSTTTS